MSHYQLIQFDPQPGRLGMVRQRSRVRAAFNLFLFFGVPVAGLLWILGYLP